MLSTVTFLALALRCSPAVHPDTAQDVARVESGFNPYAIGVVGQKQGIFPDSLNDALVHVDRLKARGRNYSVGLMQINQANFSRYNVTARQLFDPCTNLAVFEKIMTDCYRRGGSMIRALSCYYSGNFDTGQRPEATFAHTSYVQRIGYAVPSSKVDQGKQPTVPDNTPSTPQIRYPLGIARGDLMNTDAKASTTPATSVSFPSQVMRGEIVTDASTD